MNEYVDVAPLLTYPFFRFNQQTSTVYDVTAVITFNRVPKEQA